VLLGTVYFDSTSSILTSESEIMLESIAEKMRAEPNLMIDIRGYTDNADSPAANTVLSKRMADQIKNHLTVELGLSSDRIQTSGFGAKDPIASNKTDQGRKENRRVQIVIRKPDAVLTWFENDVRVQPPSLRPYWLDPVPNYYLYHDYKVTTGKKSSAHILYPNNGTLRMGEEATVIIQGSNLIQRENSFIQNLELQDGGLRAILEDAASQDDPISSASVAVGELNDPDSKTQTDEKLESLIVAYQSGGRVSDASEKTAIDKDDSVVVEQSIDAGLPTGFALGVIVGRPTGISLRSGISKKHAIGFKVGWSFPEERIHFVVDYLSYFPEWIKKEDWYPYLNVGGRLEMKQEQDERQLNLGIKVGVGIEYVYRQLGLFGELCPVVELVPEIHLDLEGGIGVHYYFRN